MKPTIEIVSHCYAGPMPQYAAMLHYQLSSLLLFPPERCEVKMTVVWTEEDKPTQELLEKFFSQAQSSFPKSIDFHPLPLEPGELFRRSIGRNRCARTTMADLIWMTDVDHVFGAGCLDALADVLREDRDSEFMRVQRLQVSKTHALGDTALARATFSSKTIFEPLELNPYDFQERKERRPIGGLQIMRQDLAHRIGYLNDVEKWQRPMDPAGGFRQCKCDVAFRKTTPAAVPINLPNLFRIRHSRAGRDGGVKDHSKK